MATKVKPFVDKGIEPTKPLSVKRKLKTKGREQISWDVACIRKAVLDKKFGASVITGNWGTNKIPQKLRQMSGQIVEDPDTRADTPVDIGRDKRSRS